MNCKPVLMTVAALAMLNLPALAADPAHVSTAKHTIAKVTDAFATLDANKDNALSSDEWTAGKGNDAQSFVKYDTNTDNAISKDEWLAQQPKKAAAVK